MCLDLEPLGLCGQGVCLNGTCLCNDGYSQNLAFYYGPLDESIIQFCDYNETVILIQTSILVALFVPLLFVQLYVIENRRQLRRIMPMLLALVTSLMAMIIRIAKSKDNLFGFDILFTLCIALSAELVLIQQGIFLNKYFEYMARSSVLQPRTTRYVRTVQKLQYPATIVAGVGYTLFFSTALVESKATARSLITAFMILLGVFHAYAVVVLFYVLHRFIVDLRIIVKTSKKQGTSQEFAERCRKGIGRTQAVRASIMSANIIGLVMYIPSFFWDGWLKYWVYFIYINYYIFAVAGFLIIRAAGRLDLKPMLKMPSQLDVSKSLRFFTIQRRNPRYVNKDSGGDEHSGGKITSAL